MFLSLIKTEIEREKRKPLWQCHFGIQATKLLTSSSFANSCRIIYNFITYISISSRVVLFFSSVHFGMMLTIAKECNIENYFSKSRPQSRIMFLHSPKMKFSLNWPIVYAPPQILLKLTKILLLWSYFASFWMGDGCLTFAPLSFLLFVSYCSLAIIYIYIYKHKRWNDEWNNITQRWSTQLRFDSSNHSSHNTHLKHKRNVRTKRNLILSDDLNWKLPPFQVNYLLPATKWEYNGKDYPDWRILRLERPEHTGLVL